MAPSPRLLLVSPSSLDRSRLAGVLPRLYDTVDAVLLRWPSATTREVLESARALAAVRPRPPLLISDRADIALAAAVEGVHLQDGGLPPLRIRSWGFSMVGASCHPARGAAVPEGVDYVTASPVFESASKPGETPLGMEALARFCASATVPVLALGGVDASRVASCRQAGAHGVAVLSAVWSARDPAAAATALRQALEAR